MLEVRKSSQRGHTKTYWLDSYHSFSFGDYYDPQNIHFGPLRVLNDDTVQPGEGFGTHPHRDMEIVSIVLQGSIAHKDSTGTNGVITVDEVQRMTAGAGIFHSEFNNSSTDILKFLQIWFIPNKTALMPSYEQKKFSHQEKKNKLLKIVSGEKEDGVIFINQDANIFLCDLDKGNKIKYELKRERGAYLHVINGAVDVNDLLIKDGDAIKVSEESQIEIKPEENSQIILFDLTMNF